MELIGNRNLLASSFVSGTQFPLSSSLSEVNQIRDWVKYKRSDVEMKKHHPYPTHSITILHRIPLKELKEILHDLARIYKKAYPYGIKEDFIEYTFSQTICDLETLIKQLKSRVLPYGSSQSTVPSNTYYYLDLEFKEYYDYILQYRSDVDFYRQYYSKVLELFENFNFYDLDTNNVPTTTTIQQHQKPQLSLKQIGYMKAYLEEPIHPQNANFIAKEFGHNSGKKLCQNYYDFCRRSIDRTGDEGSKIKNKNKIKDITATLPYLEGTPLQKAEEEVAILEDILETRY